MNPSSEGKQSGETQPENHKDKFSGSTGNGPFRVPDAYFQELLARIENRIEEAPESRKSRTITRRIPLWTMAAAAVLIAGMLTLFVILSGERAQKEPVSSGLADSGTPIPETLVAQKHDTPAILTPAAPVAVGVTNAVSTPANSSANAQIETITDEDIIEYLLEENVDPSELTQ